MKIRLLYIIVIFFGLLPHPSLADSTPEELVEIPDKIEIQKSDERGMIGSLVQKLNNEWIDIITSNNFSLEKEAVLSVIRQEIKPNILKSIMKEIGTVGVKAVLKAAELLLTKEFSIATAIGQIEKMTVNEAKEYSINWLLQKEVKVGNGNLDFEYQAIDGSWEKGKFPYIIVYKQTSLKRGGILINIYSSRTIKTPALNLRMEWEGGIDQIPPFILQISGEVEKTNLGAYRWIKGPEFGFIFDEPVPVLEFKEPTFIDGIKSSVNTTLKAAEKAFNFGKEKVNNAVSTVKKAWSAVASFISDLKSLGGANVSAPINYYEDRRKEEIIPEFEESAEENEESYKDYEDYSIFQDQLDDLVKKLDILSQKIQQIQQKKIDEPSLSVSKENIEELVENKSEEDEEDEEDVAVKTALLKPKTQPKKTYSGGKAAAPSYCALNSSAFPLKNRVVFGEIGWLGTEISSNHEWIELENITEEEISLSGWQVLDKDNQIKAIMPSGKSIRAKGVFLLERTSDDSVPDRAADFIYLGALNNDDEELYLFDNNCLLQDKAVYPEITENDILDTTTPADQEVIVPEASFPEDESSGQVIINEIAWAGTKASTSDEWIELYNPTADIVDLTGWQLIFKPLEAEERVTVFEPVLDSATPSIEPAGYFLLERTSDETVFDIVADYIFKGALNDNGGIFELRDRSGRLADSADFSAGWPAGTKEGGRASMERLGVGEWKTNNLIVKNGKDADENIIYGTPKAKNSVNYSEVEILSLPFDAFDKIILQNYGISYLVNGYIKIPEAKTLEIEPGVVLSFKNNRAGISVGGTLRTLGEEGNEVIFTSFSKTPCPGSWGRVHFKPNSTGDLSGIILEYAGGDPSAWYCSLNMAGILAEEASLEIKNSIIRENQRAGVNLRSSSAVIKNTQFISNPPCMADPQHGYGGTGLVAENKTLDVKDSYFKGNKVGLSFDQLVDSVVENNLFEENTTAISMSNSSVYFSSNDAINNQINGIWTYGIVPENSSWNKGLPYIVNRMVQIPQNSTLFIDAGTVMKFNDSYSGLKVLGTLKVLGEEGQEVLFTSNQENPSPGNWDGIEIDPSSLGSEINYSIIEYAGGGYGTPCSYAMAALTVSGTSADIRNVIVRHTHFRGIRLVNSDSVLENVTVEDTVKCMDIYGGEDIIIERDPESDLPESILETVTPSDCCSGN